jgi:hypothetical protein
LEAAGRMYQPWQEAVEHKLFSDEVQLAALGPSASLSFDFPAKEEVEPVRSDVGNVVGLIARDSERLSGTVEISAEDLHDDIFKIRVLIHNHSHFVPASEGLREQALLFSLVSAHTILSVADGEFVSLLEPPTDLEVLAADCKNIGTWPVLVGGQDSRQSMLSSPIILYDYPQIAPESPGSLFDGTEIDEILSLRIMTLTDDEKREIRQSDDRAREILDRTENLPGEQFAKLHGALRNLQSMREETR